MIDDNPDDRGHIRRMLLSGGSTRLEIIEAETGEQGIELCRTCDAISASCSRGIMEGRSPREKLAARTRPLPYNPARLRLLPQVGRERAWQELVVDPCVRAAGHIGRGMERS